jgi:hypothetical protein
LSVTILRQSAFIIEQVAVLEGTERLLDMSGAVFADCQQALRKTDSPKGFFVSNPGAHAFLLYQNSSAGGDRLSVRKLP